MQLILHQTHHKLADFNEIFTDLLADLKKPSSKLNDLELHIYPENYLTGYPLQDLALQKQFVDDYCSSLAALSTKIQKLKPNKNLVFLVGGLKYHFDDKNHVRKITNVIYQITPGQEIAAVYAKKLLPNYDIFEEKKYFKPGDQSGHITIGDYNLAVMICEDMWPGVTHDEDPVQDLVGKKYDLIINLSASPFFKGKQEKRIGRAQEISKLLKAPFAYVNRVGGEDEILFDGGSFVTTHNEVITCSPRFTAHTQSVNINDFKQTKKAESQTSTNCSSWENLYQVDDHTEDKNNAITKMTDQECQEVLGAISFGMLEYMNKCGFKTLSVALSGGIDSAAVLAIAAMTLRDPSLIEPIYMPSQYSADLSRELCEQLCENLGLRLRHFPIKFLHSTARTQFVQHLGSEVSGLTDENLQSRLRGLLIYGRSNQTGSMVLNTSNKSEIAVGYSTQYGDSVGAISLLGDLFKSQVYDLVDYINRTYNNIIPQDLVDRKPTAELREGQTDEQSLPPYERLDAILEGFLSYQKSSDDLVKEGFNKEEITKVASLILKSEYKRKQFCSIIKIDAKSFGFGYRVPITKKLTTFK